MIVFRRLILPCLFLLAIATRPAHALDPTRHISQYGHTSWRIRDGFLGAMPNVIAQTADGYLWIGTVAGLVRFDGVRFVAWTPPGGKQLPSPTVWSLLAARDGSLWIGTQAGLSHWVNGDLMNYQAGRGLISSIVEDRNGTIWITRTRPLDDAGCLCQIIGTGMRCYGKADGIPFAEGGTLVEDAEGNLWIGASTGLVRWKPGSFNAYTPSGLKSNENLAGVLALAASPDGSLWTGMAVTGPGLGLQQLIQGLWKPFVTSELDGSTLAVGVLFVDRENALWVGSTKQGIYRVRGRQVDHFRSADGLSSDSIYQFYEDREGSLWVATTKGIDMFRDLRVATFSTREGLGSGEVVSVLASRDGTTWVGGDNALDPTVGRHRHHAVDLQERKVQSDQQVEWRPDRNDYWDHRRCGWNHLGRGQPAAEDPYSDPESRGSRGAFGTANTTGACDRGRSPRRCVARPPEWRSGAISSGQDGDLCVQT